MGTAPTWSTLNSNLYFRSTSSGSLDVNLASPGQQNQTTSTDRVGLRREQRLGDYRPRNRGDLNEQAAIPHAEMALGLGVGTRPHAIPGGARRLGSGHHSSPRLSRRREPDRHRSPYLGRHQSDGYHLLRLGAIHGDRGHQRCQLGHLPIALHLLPPDVECEWRYAIPLIQSARCVLVCLGRRAAAADLRRPAGRRLVLNGLAALQLCHEDHHLLGLRHLTDDKPGDMRQCTPASGDRDL